METLKEASPAPSRAEDDPWRDIRVALSNENCTAFRLGPGVIRALLAKHDALAADYDRMAQALARHLAETVNTGGETYAGHVSRLQRMAREAIYAAIEAL